MKLKFCVRTKSMIPFEFPENEQAEPSISEKTAGSYLVQWY